MDVSGLLEHGNRIINRATMLVGGQASFSFVRNQGGMRFVASRPSARAARALRRAIDEEMPAIKATLERMARERLVP